MTDTEREAENAGAQEAAVAPGRTSEEGLEARRAQRAFLAHLRHELRTPLNAIIGYSEMLLEDAEEEGQEDLVRDLQRIHTAGKELLTLVNDIVDPAKLETGQPDLDLEAFGVAARHELRTPLNAVIGYSEMLLEEAQDQGHGGLIPDLQKIHTAGRRFLTLIDDVVTFPEIEAGEMGVETAATAVMARDAVSAIRPLAEEAAGTEAPVWGSVLVVDDNEVNRDLLARHLERQGHSVAMAENGRQALEVVRSQPFDLVLLDIMMPEMNGYEVLQRLKSDPILREIPVIMISALGEMDSVVRCIEMGATDYLPKPFNAALLRARINTSLAGKRLRDLELEYLEQVGYVVGAAQAVEAATYDPESLDSVAARDDALGQLARVFQRMAREVHLREQRLKQQLQQLRLDVEEMKRALGEPLSVYMPMDRRQALVHGETLPDRTKGVALFADISGFVPLTAALAKELGRRRGAEELTRHLNRVYGALVAEVHRYRGSVIGFSGDAITCWLDDDLEATDLRSASGQAGLRAVACGLAMQEAMAQFASVTTPTGTSFSLAIKVAVVAGPVRRFLVGDPQIRTIEVLAGRTLDELAAAERQANRGEVVAQAGIVDQARGKITVAEWRGDGAEGRRLAVVSGLTEAVPPWPWPELPPGTFSADQCRPWLLPPVYARVSGGTKQFLAELQPAASLFVSFRGINYDEDDEAGVKLDAYVRWVQRVIERYEGSLIQLTFGDKGSYLYAAFGAPVAHKDDGIRAAYAALALQSPPPELRFITDVQMGVALGQMRTGAYGSTTRRTYGMQGDKANLAARLMQAATDGILCDEAIYQAVQGHLVLDPLPPLAVKGKTEPVAVYRLTGERNPLPSDERGQALGDVDRSAVDAGQDQAIPEVDRVTPGSPTTAQEAIKARIDRLSPSEQLTLKVASVIGRVFAPGMLHDILPDGADKPQLDKHLKTLERLDLVLKDPADPTYAFRNAIVQETAYNSMLFVQRRHLHRLVAEWYERTYAGDLAPQYAILAHHWRQADDAARAVDYLEKAGQQAMRNGAYQEAERLFQQSLELDARSAVLSAEFYDQASPDYEGAMHYALTRLEEELAPELTYHNLYHTRDEVLPAARRLAIATGASEEEMRLLEIGAVYHDIGFVVQHHEHERVGADVAAQVLPGFGFGPGQIAAIQGMILATQLPQTPETLLEEILADADLDVLGREDFLSREEALCAEMAALGTPFTTEDWYSRQLQFLENHGYFTAAARSLREAGKQKNIEALKELLARRDQVTY